MAFKLGLNGKLYYNTGTYAIPVWNETPNVKDLNMTLTSDTFDVTTRGNAGFKANVATLLDAKIEFSMVYDTADTDFTAFQTHFLAKTAEEFLVLDGPTGTPGSQGLRATCVFTDFSRSENLAEAMMTKVSLMPSYVTDSAQAPAWYTQV